MLLVASVETIKCPDWHWEPGCLYYSSAHNKYAVYSSLVLYVILCCMFNKSECFMGSYFSCEYSTRLSSKSRIADCSVFCCCCCPTSAYNSPFEAASYARYTTAQCHCDNNFNPTNHKCIPHCVPCYYSEVDEIQWKCNWQNCILCIINNYYQEYIRESMQHTQ